MILIFCIIFKFWIVQHFVTHLIVLFNIYIYIYVILIYLLFSASIGSRELCSFSLVLFGIKINMYFMSHAPIGVSWQLPDYSLFCLLACFLVPNDVF